MILFRSPAFNDMVYHYHGEPNKFVKVYVTDLDGRRSFFSDGTTSDAGDLDINLDNLAAYDRVVELDILDEFDNILLEDHIEIVRPYLTPTLDDLRDLDSFKLKERMIRAVIDGVTGGFYFKRKVISYDAMGGDALPLEGGIVRIMRAWQNNVKVFDAVTPGYRNQVDFTIGRDGATIVLDGNEYYNRQYGNDTALPWAPSDRQGGGGWYGDDWGDSLSYPYNRPYRPGAFMVGGDYEFDVEYGYRHVPSDIELAAQLLAKDGSCVNSYLNKYIEEYDTDQYRIKYFADALKGTGNLAVDNILAKYAGGVGAIRAGVM